MRKLKIYLDTSVISHLDAPDVPEKMHDTHRLWEDIKTGVYDIVLSELTFAEIDRCPELTFAEIDRCPEPKRTYMRSMLADISNEYVEQNEEAERLSGLYFEVGGLPPKSRVDAMHIAIATAHRCDIVLSWNCKHIVTYRAITAVEAVNIKEGYGLIRILTPSMMVEEEE